jgi:hypothetical protein
MTAEFDKKLVEVELEVIESEDAKASAAEDLKNNEESEEKDLDELLRRE